MRRTSLAIVAIVSLLAVAHTMPARAVPINPTHAMKLFDPTTETEFEVSQRWPSGAARSQLSTINQEYLAELEAIKKKYPLLDELTPLSKEDRTLRMGQDTSLAIANANSGDEMGIAEDMKILKIARASVNTKSVPEEHREKVATPVTSEFWQSQRLNGETEQEEGMEDYAARFHDACKRGRFRERTNPKPAAVASGQAERSELSDVAAPTGASATTNGVVATTGATG